MELPEKLHAFIQQSSVALTLADKERPDIPLIDANERFERICGYSREELVGVNCRILQPEGGAGPVRDRIRAYLADDNKTEARFVIPNERKNGEPFLNLLYMTKLEYRGTRNLVLGSQFDISSYRWYSPDDYDRALREDLSDLRTQGHDFGLVVLGTFQSLATSASVIARTRLLD
jgi:PAS domain S-box-containing protein